MQRDRKWPLGVVTGTPQGLVRTPLAGAGGGGSVQGGVQIPLHSRRGGCGGALHPLNPVHPPYIEPWARPGDGVDTPSTHYDTLQGKNTLALKAPKPKIDAHVI